MDIPVLFSCDALLGQRYIGERTARISDGVKQSSRGNGSGRWRAVSLDSMISKASGVPELYFPRADNMHDLSTESSIHALVRIFMRWGVTCNLRQIK